MIRVTGLHKVLENLNKEIMQIEGRTLKGLIRGAIMVKRSMETTPPLTPVDQGNLRASQFTVTSRGNIQSGKAPAFKGDGAAEMTAKHSAVTEKYLLEATFTKQPMVILGYSAFYATYVHENIGATFQRPSAGAKWLQAAIENERDNILRVIREEAKIKP